MRETGPGRATRIFLLLPLALVATALPARNQPPAANHVSPPRANAHRKPPTFYRDVLPILEQHCQVCHRRGEIGPMPLETYAETKPYAEKIREKTQKRLMPPWFADPCCGKFSNNPSLPAQQIRTLAAWAAAGAPEGNPRDAPPPRVWAKGWRIPKPDDVVRMPVPVKIPARGIMEYTYEIVPTGFRKDRWVQMSEIRPSNRAYVHHAVVYVRPPGSKWLAHAPRGVPFTAATLKNPQDKRDAEWTDSSLLNVYTPGSSPEELPEGMAKFIPAGSDLVFQMHYMPKGHRAEDQTSIGLVFSKKPPTKRVLTLQLTDDWFVIPPEDPDFRTEVHGTIPNNCLLLSFFPHMHLRGKKFEYNIIHPDGRVETLLRVHYNFYWQESYTLAKPRPLRAGTMLQAVAWFDNSKSNPLNPDPRVAVRWGDQSYDEMMVGFFDVAVPANVNKWQFFVRHKARTAPPK